MALAALELLQRNVGFAATSRARWFHFGTGLVQSASGARLRPMNIGRVMKDMQAHLEKLRVQIVECEMIRDLATDLKKRELFARLAEHFKVLAGEVERTMAHSADALLGRKTQEPSPGRE